MTWTKRNYETPHILFEPTDQPAAALTFARMPCFALQNSGIVHTRKHVFALKILKPVALRAVKARAATCKERAEACPNDPHVEVPTLGCPSHELSSGNAEPHFGQTPL